jgi:hypothetical protein
VRPQRPSLEFGEGRTTWATSWTRESPSKESLLEQWKQRWRQHVEEPPGRRRAPTPAAQPLFSDKALDKHRHLSKHESSLLTQIRTGKVGLRAFLFERGVPTVATPRCTCGDAPETAAHLVLDCREFNQQRVVLQGLLYPASLRTYRDFAAATARTRSVKPLIHWLLATGRFPEYRLAERYRAGGEAG